MAWQYIVSCYKIITNPNEWWVVLLCYCFRWSLKERELYFETYYHNLKRFFYVLRLELSKRKLLVFYTKPSSISFSSYLALCVARQIFFTSSSKSIDFFFPRFAFFDCASRQQGFHSSGSDLNNGWTSVKRWIDKWEKHRGTVRSKRI